MAGNKGVTDEHVYGADVTEVEHYLDLLGWTKRDLAAKLGVRPQTITEWGKSPPQYAIAYLKLAYSTRHRAKDLVTITDPPPKPPREDDDEQQ